jgi:hypothetical protein
MNLMSKDDKTVASILFGISFVVILKLTQWLLGSLLQTNDYVTLILSGTAAALLAIALTRRFFPSFLNGA